jgi:cytochrome P450
MPTEPNELVTGDAEVSAILNDPAYVVPPAPPVPAGEHGTLAWLRAHVARFCDGEVHDRRRELAEYELAKLDPGTLRAAATAKTRDAMAQYSTTGEPFDAMIIAKRVPVAVLAEALGVGPDTTARATDAVLASASGYPNPDLAGPDAEAGVKFLTEVLAALDPAALGPAAPDPAALDPAAPDPAAPDTAAPDPAALGPAGAERLANRIGLLEQACDATAALIGNSLISAFADPASADEVIARTIAEDPPVRRTRRLAPDGTGVTVDLSAHTFGAGRRPCPGQDQATALAAGVLDALLDITDLADQQLTYVPSPNLRMPAELLVELTG